MSPITKHPAKGLEPQVLWSMLGDAHHLRDIEEFEAAGGYAQLRAALDTERSQLIDEIKVAGIRGRGGAGFPTGMKMGFIPTGTDKPIYLVCNFDESEPCTYKDREIAERLPHLLIEGCLIGAHAIGSNHAFIYIRGEYLETFEVLAAAAEQARAKGYIGRDIMGKGADIDLVIHRGAGAYICGEETALLSSLNGVRGNPTVKPPFPAISGLYAAPTLVNNVESLATVPRILAMGGAEYAKIGVPKSGAGTRVFSLSGHVNKPGNYELPIGTPLSTLIDEYGGGVLDGRTLKAVIPGGSSTPILKPEHLEQGITLDFDAMAAAGSMAGSGAVTVIDDRTCMVQLAVRVAEFYRHESCGKCTPCREGTKWVTDILARIEAGDGRQGDAELLTSICRRVLGNCLCPLGDAMAMPILSYLERFGEEFQRHIDEGGCPFGDSPLEPVVRKVVEHHRSERPSVVWAGALKRGASTTGTGVSQ